MLNIYIQYTVLVRARSLLHIKYYTLNSPDSCAVEHAVPVFVPPWTGSSLSYTYPTELHEFPSRMRSRTCCAGCVPSWTGSRLYPTYPTELHVNYTLNFPHACSVEHVVPVVYLHGQVQGYIPLILQNCM